MQRQRLGVSAFSISLRLGSGVRLISALACMTMPGMQKPHWMPPLATKARAKACWRNSSSPSVVVTTPPATFFMGVTQESTALPLRSTVQAPQAA